MSALFRSTRNKGIKITDLPGSSVVDATDLAARLDAAIASTNQTRIISPYVDVMMARTTELPPFSFYRPQYFSDGNVKQNWRRKVRIRFPSVFVQVVLPQMFCLLQLSFFFCIFLLTISNFFFGFFSLHSVGCLTLLSAELTVFDFDFGRPSYLLSCPLCNTCRKDCWQTDVTLKRRARNIYQIIPFFLLDF